MSWNVIVHTPVWSTPPERGVHQGTAIKTELHIYFFPHLNYLCKHFVVKSSHYCHIYDID